MDNFTQCGQAYDDKILPKNRKRINNPINIPDFEMAEREPNGKDLGVLLKKVASKLVDYAEMTAEIGIELEKNKEYESDEIPENKNSIQHFMDYTRQSL